jgi:uncharacterized protein
VNVVIDTNVFVSSFFGGLPRKVISLWEQDRITWCVSKEILHEYTAVLVRLGLAGEKELAELLRLFAEGRSVLFAARTPTLAVVRQDPADNKFIECAVALKAETIVTGDKHLLAIEDYAGIRILSPREFLADSFPDLL